jgi:hypothetical protein
MKGMITGLTLDDSVNDLARKFNIALEVRPSILLSSFFSLFFLLPLKPSLLGTDADLY